ncbi:major facilitator superfamily domain-containing protein [Diplogelasinospora grovesii]|uniref:Major facilitator superfamily domain-containing protein n=1 Tax=Diplogelasinospora grovesii TaxID=303347 RepID=A0AAN6S4Q9_9PEZI|nr:major facilitator superfamily domain-containing protein [Diplogelasinospora grovesii]
MAVLKGHHTNHRGAVADTDISESTPLLSSDGDLPIIPPVPISESSADNHPDIYSHPNGVTPSHPHSHDEDDDKPLPFGQIAVLCYARWVEPVAFFSIFPYINKMCQENGHLSDADVGFYSGLIESLFSLTQMSVMILWGRAADRYGRKPILVSSLLGVTLATSLFGLATTIWQMVLFRCLAGVFAGTIVTIRTMISEHSTQKTQARAFSWFAFTGNMGILFGPLLGGALADPAAQYPNVFTHPFFRRYPYALPSFLVGIIGASAVVVTALFAEETLTRPDKSDTEGEAADAHPVRTGGSTTTTTLDLLRSPGVPTVLYVYSHIMLLAFSYTTIIPVFLYTPVHLGGFGFTPLQISLLMGLNGLAQAIWILLVFPPLQHRIGTNGVLRACALAYPIFFATEPFLNLLLKNDMTTTFWVVCPAMLCLGCGVSMSFTAIQLALNDVTPSPQVLGTLNALALSITSGVRSFSPALFASLFAIGARTQWLWGYAIWVLMVIIAAGFTVVSRYMPDYEELKKQREEAAREAARME